MVICSVHSNSNDFIQEMTLGSVNQPVEGGQVRGGSGYSLRRAINTTLNAHRSLIDSASH